MTDPHAITSREALRAITGEAGDRPAQKVIDHIDTICARFIAASPFAVLATRGADGLPDLSPKGDPAGFVAVLDDKTLALPDRPGNRRFDSYENILHTPEAALIFVIPGHNDTLRVAGTARLTRDPALCERLSVNGRPAQFVLLLTVEEAYFHCSKCMVRSRMWQPEAWPDTADVPSMAEAMVAHGKLVEKQLVADVEEMARIIADDAQNRLY
jgi:PPOX class probable FMN-dependent enzyme